MYRSKKGGLLVLIVVLLSFFIGTLLLVSNGGITGAVIGLGGDLSLPEESAFNKPNTEGSFSIGLPVEEEVTEEIPEIIEELPDEEPEVEELPVVEELEVEEQIVEQTFSSQSISISVTPVLTSLILNSTDPESNTSDQNLTVYNESTNALKIIYNWFKNQTSILLLNMPFEGINVTISGNAYDYSGYGNNGTVIGAVWNRTGGFDQMAAYEFFGTNNSINISNAPELDILNEFSVELWFNGQKANIGGQQDLITKWQVNGNFSNETFWEAFDPSRRGIGNDATSYWGGAFDGRYIYFSPYWNSVQHGEVLRYDTLANFSNETSRTTFDAVANNTGISPRGFNGALFDGKYVYFIPEVNATDRHGEFLRYNTSSAFNDNASWDTFSPAFNGIEGKPEGFRGGTFDGRYLYFAPTVNASGSVHGDVLRYDTNSSFDAISSWEVFDAENNRVGQYGRGFAGAVYATSYVYFTGNIIDAGGSPTSYHGEILRYNTSSEFTENASWDYFDPGENNVGGDPDGYYGGAFDGRYIYFSPYYNGSTDGYHDEILRYDTTVDFKTASSWDVFDLRNNSIGTNPRGFKGANFDGRYVYFIPNVDSVFTNPIGGDNDEMVRYDTLGTFHDTSSWTAFSAYNRGIGSAKEGYQGAIFDGRYMYYVPYYNGTGNSHGEVLRFDTTAGNSSFKFSYSQVDQGGGYSGAPFGTTAIINTINRSYTVSSNKRLNASVWHHTVFTRNKTGLAIYVDGILENAINYSSSDLSVDSTPIILGNMLDGYSYYNGTIDELRICIIT